MLCFHIRLTHLLAVFCRALLDIFLEFRVEIIHVAVTDLFGDLIDLQGAVDQKILGMFNTDLVYKYIEALTDLFGEDLAKIRAVVAEKWCDILQLDIVHIIVLDIMNDIIHHTLAGRIADGADDHFKLLCEEQHDLIEVIFVVDKLNDLGVTRKRYVRIMVQMENLFLMDRYRSVRKSLICGMSSSQE